MDVIEEGFNTLIARIEGGQQEVSGLAEEIRTENVHLLARMGVVSHGVVVQIGLNLLRMGKQDTKGEIYDPVYHKEKVIILGKVDVSEPDEATLPWRVVDEFCALGEKGAFFLVVYRTDGFLIESEMTPITPARVFSTFGDEAMFMLYRAMHDYLSGQDELIGHLKATLSFITPDRAARPGDTSRA
jgi:hypothetical protein